MVFRKNILIRIILMLLILVSTLSNFYILTNLPIFSDGAIYAKIIQEINEKREFITYNPVLGDIGKSLLPHPPLFFISSSLLNTFIEDINITLMLMTFLPIILIILLIYSIFSKYYNSLIAIYGAILLALTPMFFWIVSHRLIEPLVYFMVILFIYFYLKSNEDNHLFSKEYLFLFFFLLIGLFLLKITVLPVIFAIFVHLFYYSFKKKKLKFMFKVCFIVIILIFIFLFPFKDHISSITKYISIDEGGELPSSLEDKLDFYDSNINEYKQRVITAGGRLPYFQNELLNGNIQGVFQFYSAFPLSKNANLHWFSPSGTNLYPFYLILFLFGILLFLKFKNYRQNDYSFFIILFLLFLTPFLFFIAIKRLLFYSSILLIFIYGFGIYYLFNKINMFKIYKLLFVFLLIIFLFFTMSSEINDVLVYKYSFAHSPLEVGGITELEILKKDINLEGERIFTPSPEVAYYLNTNIVWNWEAFFILDEEDLLEYFKYYEINYLLIPHYSTSLTFWNGEGRVPNIKENWNNVLLIPTDSILYDFLNDGSKIKEIKRYDAFTLYELVG